MPRFTRVGICSYEVFKMTFFHSLRSRLVHGSPGNCETYPVLHAYFQLKSGLLQGPILAKQTRPVVPARHPIRSAARSYPESALLWRIRPID
jgi:hypothetical protein